MITTMDSTTEFDLLPDDIATAAPTYSPGEKTEFARIKTNRISGPVRNRNCGDRVVLPG